MQLYLVGGAIRDKFLGLSIHDRDWVVVGASPQEMLMQNYSQVRNNFPVFLHPETKEEYALARTETKIGQGYNGFAFNTSPDITLDMDLQRRDLTINAIAESLDGQIVDPYQGIEDIKNKMLRHISPSFGQDPVRLLRISRFMARFAHLGFSVAPETKQLLKQMTDSNLLDELTAELIWKETEKALKEKNPEKFFETLAECGALPKLFPGLKIDTDIIHTLKKTAELTPEPVVRFAVVVSLANKDDKSAEKIDLIMRYLHCPHEFKELVHSINLYYKNLQSNPLSAAVLLEIMGEFHLLINNHGRLFDPTAQQNNSFQRFLATCQILAQLQGEQFDPASLIVCAQKTKLYDPRTLISEGFSGKNLKEKLKEKRLEIINEYLKSVQNNFSPQLLEIKPRSLAYSN